MSKAVVVPECIQNLPVSNGSTLADCLRILTVTLGLFIFLNSFSNSIYAQAADEAGVKPFATLQGGAVEDINLSNHTLNLHPTLVSYPQRGGKLEFKLVVNYTNATWQEKEICLPGIPKTCNWLWFPDSGGGAKINVVLSRGIPFFFTQPLNTTTNPPQAYFVRLSDGSTHPAGQIGSNLYETLDSTGILLNTSTGDIISPDGVRANGSSFVITDPNGNQITQTSSGWVDTMGRNIPGPPGTNGNIASGGVSTTDFSHCTGQLPIDSAATWTVPGPSGEGPTTYKFCFVKVHVFTKHWSIDDSTHSEMNNDEVEIQSIVLPDLSTWTFDYSQPDANGINWGDLVKITYPTGGSISYVWQTSHGCSVSETFNDASFRAVTQRLVDANDGSGPQKWQYSGSTVTDPLGNDTVHTYTNLSGCSFYETQTQTYNGSQTAGDLIQTVTTEYSWTLNPNTATGNPPPTPTAINVVAKSRTTTLANGLVKKTSYTYDPGFTYTPAGGGSLTALYGKVISQVDSDWGQGSAGQPLRETDTQYQFLTDSTGAYRNAGLLETPNSVIVKDGAGTIAAKTTFGYDETYKNISTQPSGITTQHVGVATPRGNRTSTTRWVLLGNTPITSHTIPYDTVPYADLSDPQTLNLYSYVRNSAVARFDADEHFRTSAGSADSQPCSDGTDQCSFPNDNTTIAWNDASNTATITQSLGTKTVNEDGTVTYSITTTTVTYSTATGHEGEFLGGSTQRESFKMSCDCAMGERMNTNADGTHFHDPHDYGPRSISAGTALKTFGVDMITRATTPQIGFHDKGLFAQTTGHDMAQHPFKYGAIAAGAASLPVSAVSAVGGAVLGVIGLIDSIVDDATH